MATLREYYEKDFDHTFRFHIAIPFGDTKVNGSILFDFGGYTMFLSLYFPNILTSAKHLSEIIEELAANKSVEFVNTIQLPTIKGFYGELKIKNDQPPVILNRIWGDPVWVKNWDLPRSKRIYFYLEANINEVEMKDLHQKAKDLGIDIQFRNRHYQKMRDQLEAPYAFISHDSRDKDSAKEIAVGLQKRLCPVWYDEFSLRVGDNLRDSIENGIKKCKKCIVIISPNMISNNGWTKVEFESVFTRQVLKNEKIFLPIWYNVTKEQVYDYSPSLANILALDYNALGPEEISRKLSLVLNE